MKSHLSVFSLIKTGIVYAAIFLFPIIFLPITQEYYITAKLYFLGFVALALIGVSLVEFISTKKIIWEKRPFDNNILLVVVAVALSILISSSDKITGILNLNFGLVAIFSLAVLYFYLAREPNAGHHDSETLGYLNYFTVLTASSVLVALISIIMFFQPFKNVALPPYLQFLTNQGFTTIGSQLDLAIFLGFLAVAHAVSIMTKQEGRDDEEATQSLWMSVISICIFLIAIIFTLFSLLKPSAANQLNLSATLPPYRISWYGAVETLKQPLTALFGVGVSQFSSMFTAVKDGPYNSSPLWQIQSFGVSRSVLLHIMTETGLLGLVAFCLLLIQAIRTASKHASLMHKMLLGYMIIIILVFPPSLPTFFLLFVLLGVMAHSAALVHGHEHGSHKHAFVYDMSTIPPLYAGLILLAVAFLGASAYFLGRAYASEVYFKKSLDAIVNNNARDLYDNQRQAVLLNPYNDRFRVSFAQTNLLIANTIAQNATQPTPDGQPRQITDLDRQNITQAIQASINESKAAVTLNPKNAGHWENLATVYRNILNVVQGADGWAIASYQEAIKLDPQNPSLRLNLGGIYYSLGAYEEAAKMFEQAAILKPDWSNARYNLAWASAQKGDYVRAVQEMQQVLNLLDPLKDQGDIKKAQTDLETFVSKLPQATGQTPESAQPQQLSLPTPPPATIEPKLQLKEEEAKPPSPPPATPTESASPSPAATTLTPTREATGSAGGP